MKKVMLLAAMLAMVLAAAVPAFAQTVAIDEGDDTEYNGACQNIIGSVGDIESENNASAESEASADADASADSAAAAEANSAAEIAQASGVSLEQANECFNIADADGDGVLTALEIEEFLVVAAAEVQYASGSASSSATAASGGTLPETGGASLFALGAGALLVAGGLLARRIVR